MLNEKSFSKMPNTNTALTLIKSHYPAFNEMEDQRFLSIIGNMTMDPKRSKKILLQNKLSETPGDYDYKAALDAFRLPEGWGHFLRSFTDRVIDGIPEGMSLTAIADIAGDPYFILLLQIVQIYAFFLEGSNSSGKTELNSIVTRQDAQEIVKENAHLGALMSNAKELLDLFRLLTKLRRGETRLHQRIIDCINRMLSIEW